MATDMGKLFDVYWYLGKPGARVPTTWPKIYSTDINRNTSMQIKFNGTDATTYLSVSHCFKKPVSDMNVTRKIEFPTFPFIGCYLYSFPGL
jgi:hypothetical protein